jgi:hypothetical protein
VNVVLTNQSFPAKKLSIAVEVFSYQQSSYKKAIKAKLGKQTCANISLPYTALHGFLESILLISFSSMFQSELNQIHLM